MKVIKKFDGFVLAILFIFLFSFVTYNITYSITHSKVDTTEGSNLGQSLPIRLTKEYEVISAELVDENLTITIKERFSGAEYKSYYPSDILKNKICSNYVYKKPYWDCTNEYKTMRSMILELGYKSLKMI